MLSTLLLGHSDSLGLTCPQNNSLRPRDSMDHFQEGNNESYMFTKSAASLL